MKKKLAVFLLIVLVIVAILGVFRWLGLRAEEQKKTEDLTYYQALLDQERGLENIVTTRLQNKGLSSIFTIDKTYTRYQVEDLNLIEEVNEEVITQYAADIVKILKPYESPRPNEAEVVVTALNEQNPDLLTPVKQTVAMHTLALNQLLSIPVPKDAQLAHIRLINSISQVIPLLQNMANIFSDPTTGLESGQEYLKKASGFFWATENINLYFANHDIIFPEETSLKLYFNLD